jgi:nucleotide-binding universal stress UspA family protein
MRRILIAIDGSAASDPAIDVGLDLAETLGAEVMFLHSAELSRVLIGTPYHGEAQLAEREAARGALEAALRGALRRGIEAEAELVDDSPAEAILELAREWDADLIVVGSHGRGRIGRALLGSVSDEVVARADRAVLVARPHVRLPLATPSDSGLKHA